MEHRLTDSIGIVRASFSWKSRASVNERLHAIYLVASFASWELNTRDFAVTSNRFDATGCGDINYLIGNQISITSDSPRSRRAMRSVTVRCNCTVTRSGSESPVAMNEYAGRHQPPHVSPTFSCTKKGDSSTFHYVVVQESTDGPWRLRVALA
jgi:hypothetical protein